MPTRDFIIIPDGLPGAEITIDRNTVGFEQTCHICGEVIRRDEPTPGTELPRRSVARPGMLLRFDVTTLVPGLSAFRFQVPFEICGLCSPELMAPFAPAIALQLADDTPDVVLLMLGLKRAGADVDEHQGADVDEHPHGPDITHELGATTAPSSSTSTTAAAADVDEDSDTVRSADVDHHGAELAEV